MKTEQIKKNYFSLILSLITIGFNWFLFTILKESDKEANNVYRKKINFEKNEKVLNDYYLDYHFAIKTLNVVYSLSFLFFAIIATIYIFSKTKNSLKRNLFLLIYWILLIWPSLPNGEPELYSNELEFKGFLKIFLALPFIYYIYQDIIVGKKIDKTPFIKNQLSSNYEATKNELSSLKDADIISEKDYQDKLEKIKYHNERENFLLTQEYKALENLKNSGIFTEEEFNRKLDEIINSKIK